MHQALLPAIREVVEHHDPEGILSFNVNVSNLLPMVKMMEQQYRDNKRLERELTSCSAELGRILGGV
jgi:hypothetical protein